MPDETGKKSPQSETGQNPWEMKWGYDFGAPAPVKKAAESVKEAVKRGLEPWNINWGGKGQAPKENRSTGSFNLSSYISQLEGVESGGNPNARASTSSAVGLHQFTASTWNKMVDQLNLPYTLSDRTNPERSREVARAFTQQNYRQAKEDLGREPTNTDVYLYHFLGEAGGKRFLQAPIDAPAAEHVDKGSLRANRKVFEGKTVGDVINTFRRKFEGNG